MTDLVLLAGIVASAAAAASGARPGEWTCHRPTDGSAQAVLTVLSNESNATLLLRCSEGRPGVSLKWGMAGGSGPILVTTRLDQGEPTSGWWPRSPDRKEVQFAGDPLAYLGALRAAKSLVVRLSPDPVPVADARSSGFQDEASRSVRPPTVDVPLTMTFDLSGLGAAISEARGSCGTR